MGITVRKMEAFKQKKNDNVKRKSKILTSKRCMSNVHKKKDIRVNSYP